MSQLEFAGAQAVSDINTLLAPFVRKDHLSYNEVRQQVQHFIWDLNFESRQAFQTPFTNISVNSECPGHFANIPAIIGGEPTDRTYDDFKVESDMILTALCEGLLDLDADGRPFTFPIPTMNLTKKIDWDSDPIDKVMEVSGKLGSFYYMNYIGSGIPEDTVRSMCCRLMLDMDELPPTSGLWNFSGGTGSLGVVSINMPRIGYISKNDQELYENLHKQLDIAKEYLMYKDRNIRDSLKHGLLPFSAHYGLDMDRYFRTIGLIGLNELCQNYLGVPIFGQGATKFVHDILTYMREYTRDAQIETKKLWNLEMTPGEGSCHRLARKDEEKFNNGIWNRIRRWRGDKRTYVLGDKGARYYTTLLVPPMYDIPMAKLDVEMELLPLFTGGTVSRNFIGEVLQPRDAKTFVRWLSNKTIPYFDITATFGVCNECNTFIRGSIHSCPTCSSSNLDTYSRVVGYYRATRKWNPGKQAEFNDRTYSHLG
jgi:ribonucleoside-triphosphate reductase